MDAIERGAAEALPPLGEARPEAVNDRRLKTWSRSAEASWEDEGAETRR